MLAARLNVPTGSNSTLAKLEVGMEATLNVNETSGNREYRRNPRAASRSVGSLRRLPELIVADAREYRSSEVAADPVLICAAVKPN